MAIYILEWTRALNAREVRCRRLKWPRPSWIRQTFCTFVEPCREAAPFRSIHFSPLVSSCRVSPGLLVSYLVPASVALVFSCLGFSCLRLLWSPLVVSPFVLSSLVLVPACSLWGLLGSLFGASGGSFWGPLETDCGPLDGPWSLQGHSWACPGPPLGPPGKPLGGSWRLLDLSWAAPGRSWRLLGGPRGALGASRAALGALWAAPKSLSAQKPKFVDSTAFFITFWPPGPSWNPLGALLALGWLLGGSWQA